MNEQLNYLLHYANTLLCLAKYAKSQGNITLMRNYAKQGKDTINLYNKLKNEDKTKTYIQKVA